MRKISLKQLLLMALFISLCRFGTAQTPFSEDPVAISKIAVAAERSVPKKTSFWQRLITKIEATFTRLASNISGKTVSQKLPDFVSRSAAIPGHETREFVCQGICYLPTQVVSPASKQLETRNYRYLVLSYYPKEEYTSQPSQLVVIDMQTRKAVRRFSLYVDSDTAYKGHAGGIAAAGKYLWVASGYKLYAFDIQSVLDFINDKKAAAKSVEGIPASLQLPEKRLAVVKTFAVDTSASFLSFDGNYLWAGDFVKTSDKNFAPVKHHTTNPWKKNTWIAGYKVDANGTPTATKSYSFVSAGKSRKVYKPDYLLFCRDSVQGMAVCGDYIALSVSYGAANSKLAFYRNPIGTDARKVSFKPEGQKKTFKADACLLADGENWLKTLELPAGAEDLEYDGRYLYVTFEGASENYRKKWIAKNPLISIEGRFYLISPGMIAGLDADN